MASTLPQNFENLPAINSEKSALKKLLEGDLELKFTIARRQEEVQAQYSYAKKAAEALTNCLAATTAVKDACTVSTLSTKGLREAIKSALNVHGDQKEVLATISSTNGILAAWAEIMALTDTMLTQLDKVTTQVETHLHLAAYQEAVHASTHIAASGCLRSCTESLRVVNRSIVQIKLHFIPTEILVQIFMEAVDTRQHEITNSLSSYRDTASSHSDIKKTRETFNLVPFTLSAICKRWRAICRSTARLWRYARVPTPTPPYPPSKVIGKTQFEQCLLLARNQPLELTIYPCYDAIHQGATYSDLVLPSGSQILKVHLISYDIRAIPDGIPSPTELCVVAPANFKSPYTQAFPTKSLANTKMLRCTGLLPEFADLVGIQSLYIFLSTRGTLPSFCLLLQNCSRLKELHLEIGTSQGLLRTTHFTHLELLHLSLTGHALPWLIYSFSQGCRLPCLTRLVLTDINGFSATHDISQTRDQFSLITHIEVQAVSTPSAVAKLRPLFDAATALHTLTLAGSAVEPTLNMLTLPVPKRLEKLILREVGAIQKRLYNYLVAVGVNGGGISGMKAVWNNCQSFVSQNGKVSGEFHF